MGVRRWVALGAAAVAVALTVSLAPGASAAGGDWSQYLGGPLHPSAGHDGVITAAAVPALHQAWHVSGAKTVDSSVTVVGNRAYFASRSAILYALDATTGAVIWTKQLDRGSSTYCPAKGSVATPAVVPDPVTGVLTVYAAGAHHLYAVGAATGTQRWSRTIGPATAAGEALYFNWSSPTVSNGRIYMGLGANCEARLVRGGLVSVDQHTGALQHTYYDTPAGTVGGSIWSSAASDGTSVWVTTGNPDPNGSAVYHSYSVVRLSAATLAEQDWWTVPEPQAADLDFGSSPVLVAASVGGVRTPLVAACNKNGVFYAWRQSDLAAGPVWQRTLTSSDTCLGSAAIDGTSLYVASGATSVGGDSVPGAVRALDPATGRVRWEQPLPCGAVGSPTVDDVSHVLAVPLYGCAAGSGGVAFFGTAGGAPLGRVGSPSKLFAQPVFAQGRLYVATEGSGVSAYTG